MSLMSKMSRGGAQRALRWGLLIGMFVGYALAEDDVFKFSVLDKAPTKLLIDKLNDTFDNSGRVDVKYTDLDSGVESAHYNKDLATTEWQYLFSRQCDTGCDYVGVELHRRLATGLRIDGECPPPFSMVIEFYGQNRNTHPKQRIYVDFLGNCFIFDGQSYFESDNKSLLELVNQVKGPLAFVTWASTGASQGPLRTS